jgi:hypothetical protein
MKFLKTLVFVLLAGSAALALAAGTDRDPMDGTGVANNPNAEYGVLFGSICTWFLPGNGPFPPFDSQADEGMNIAFAVMFGCDPNDPNVGTPQEDIDFDPLPNE